MRRVAFLALFVTMATLASSGCREEPRLRGARTREPGAATDRVVEASAARVRFEPAGEGDVVALVRELVTRARAEGRAPMVYVGATWCEPCRYFHAAAERGELDAQLPPITFLEFDRDHDGERLDAAGYRSRMIPLFVSPNDDGTPSERRMEGSIHGAGSPQEIVPRMLAILPPR
ncbi:MAG: thioredoxin family protein [Deltaproteobacteria bacterium]|nr:thioredoxin family protein [Deltaproteobacteria bacterium]